MKGADLAKSVVVTGCGAGIGRAIFERLLADGWTPVGVEIDETTSVEVRGIAGEKGDVLVGDVADPATLASAAARARELGPLLAWVNNAGVAITGNLHAPDRERVERLFAINLFAVYWGCVEAIRAFVEQQAKGAIVNISSIHGRTAFPGWAAYDTAKGGVDALTRYIAVEYGPAGIRANAIAPGAIRTPLAQQVIDESPDPERTERELALIHPVRRIGEPAEIAAVASFLLSADASFVTGQSIAVDGGATARCFPYDPDPGLLEAYDISQ